MNRNIWEDVLLQRFTANRDEEAFASTSLLLARRAAGLAVLLVVLGLGMAGVNQSLAEPPVAAAPEAPKPRLDRLGDPLPPHALMRLGTLRYRVPAFQFLACHQMLPSGTIIYFEPHAVEVRWLDPLTGRVTDSWRLSSGLSACGFSPDGRLGLFTDRKVFSLWDLHARRLLRTFGENGDIGTQVTALFAPDGKVAATNSGYNYYPGFVQVWDLNTGRELWHEGEPRWGGKGLTPLGFLPDRETFVVLSNADNRVSLRDRATGRERRSFATMPRNSSRMVRLAPDGKTLFMGTGGPAVRAWDVNTGKEREPLGGHTTQASRMAISPDSKIVLTGGGNSLVQVWDWPSGKRKRQINIGNRTIHSLAVLPDGRHAQLIFWGENTLRLFDLETGRELRPPLEGHRGPVAGMAIAPDGKVVSAGADNTIRIWDLPSGRLLHTYRTTFPVGASSLALSSNGRLVATADFNRGKILLHDRDRGLVRTIDAGVDHIGRVTFAPKGRLLASLGWKENQNASSPHVIQFWDADTGREVRHLEKPRYGWPTFSPDGRWLAGFGDKQIRLTDAATGQVRQTLPVGRESIAGLAFSPDGRMLACRDWDGISLLELASGQECQRIEVARSPLWGVHGALFFTPDGRWLAAAVGTTVSLWDLLGTRDPRQLNGHDQSVTALAFAADGRTLVSAGFDSTMVVWDVAEAIGRRPDPATASAVEVTAAWKDLAAADAKAAFRAIRILSTAPGRSLPLLREHLRPVPIVAAKEIERWLAGLDSERFAERQRAAVELQKHADQAEAALRRFLAGQPTLEARHRAEQALARLQGPVTDPEQLRSLRALEVLEFIGTAEARDLLRKLAGGAPNARATREAAASLRRLNRSGPIRKP